MASRNSLENIAYDNIALLASHFYFRTDLEFLELFRGIAKKHLTMIDSGAFSDQNYYLKSVKRKLKYTRIDINEYIAWCEKEYSKWATWYIVLDIVKDPQGTLKNYNKMLDAGLAPIPVLHSATQEMLNEFLKNAPMRYACVGGIAGTGGNVKNLAYSQYNTYNNMAGGNILLHALGFFKLPQIWNLPIHSCDSTTWNNGFRFGEFSLLDRNGNLDRFDRSFRRTIENKKDIRWARRMDFVSHCNAAAYIDKTSFYRGKYAFAGFATLFSYLKLYFYSLYKHDLIYYFAVSSPDALFKVANVLCAITSKDGFDYSKICQVVDYFGSLPKEKRSAYIYSLFNSSDAKAAITLLKGEYETL